MKRICIAISSNDKDTTMHLEIYAPEYKGDLKGLIQICHGMTEYMGIYGKICGICKVFYQPRIHCLWQ